MDTLHRRAAGSGAGWGARVWAVTAGVLLIALGIVDAVMTVLHPTRRGPVTLVTGVGVWSATRLLARCAGRPRILSSAGMLAVLAIVVVWTALMWAGFALLFLPNMAGLSYSPSVSYGSLNFLDALYMSGMSLTTVGFGDIVGGTDTLRLITVIEAAAGFGLITAAITYILSIYPLTSELRSAARTVQTQADDPVRAAELVVLGGGSYLQSLQERLISVDEDTQRFPFLYYFRASDPSAALHTFIRGATMVCLQARWGISTDAAPYARVQGRELQLRLQHVIDHYAIGFLMRDPRCLRRPLDAADARHRWQRLTAAAGDWGVDRPGEDEADLDEFARFVGCCQTFLDDLAEQHLYPPAQLLPAASPP
ncbi:hypothetical protein Xph01_55260 [Micromonospora phaseoli]|nr:hypothetical protein Xph01_55260 [Micromonospora phaseoli]